MSESSRFHTLFGARLAGHLATSCATLLITTAVSVCSVSLAGPVLPSAAVASQAVKAALSDPRLAEPKAQPKVVAASVKKATDTAAAARARAVSQASTSSAPRSTGRSAVVHSTAYNSTPGQTDASPYVTATGTRVRPGVVALSHDLLRRFPYGTRVTLEDMSGRYNNFLQGRVFVVEDTMNPRIGNTVDVWMSSRSAAMSWGSRNIRITAVR